MNRFVSRDYIDKEFSFESDPGSIDLSAVIWLVWADDETRAVLWMVDVLRDRMIYGIIQEGGKYHLEFYIYNSYRESPIRIEDFLSQTGMRASLLSQQLNYFMFSFSPHNRHIDCIDVYSGRHNYRVWPKSIQKRNTYNFYPRQEIKAIIHDIRQSVFSWSDKVIGHLLFFLKFLYADGTVCVSKKVDRDALYFSGMNYEGFLSFLKFFGYKPELCEFFIQHYGVFARYRFDVWMDYTLVWDEIVFVKSGIYFLYGTPSES